MTVDKNDFFRQSTMRLCASLDIESAMWRCLEYIKKFIPVSGMNLVLFEPGLVAMQTVSQVTLSGMEKMKRIIPLPEEIRDYLRREWDELKDVMILNRPKVNPVFHAITEAMGKPHLSVMIMSLEIEEQKLGGFAIYVDGENRYTEKHARLLSLLHDPFAIAMSNALKHKEVLKLKDMLADDNRYLHQELLRISGDEIIGKDGGLKRVMEMVRQVAPLNSPVLLQGETGVGKEVIANAIHSASPRKNGPFIKVNCGAIPETLMDTELFGHEKGAFTGAIAQKRGRFERAHKGTILLDEIAELPSQAQVRLLRVLQRNEIDRVGGSKPIIVNTRIIAATHRDLKDMVNAKRFREDLWFRLNVFPINIPPLRERKDDIPALVRYFIRKKSIEINLHQPPSIPLDVLERLKRRPWKGNVRELENLVERFLIQYRGQEKMGALTFEEFIFPQEKYEAPPLSIEHNDTLKLKDMVADEVHRVLHQFFEKIISSREKHEIRNHGVKDNGSLKLDDVVSAHIQKVLDLTNGKVQGHGGAAEMMGIHPSTLRNKMKKLGIPFSQR